MPPCPVLTSVLVVCRECLAFRELPHVVLHIDAFLGVGSMVTACKLGSLRLMSRIAVRDTEARWGEVAKAAAKAGHVHILQWLSDFHADRCDWGVEILDTAAEFGHLSSVQWLHTHRQDGRTTRAMDRAARGGFLPIVKWLHENRFERMNAGKVWIMNYATKMGYVHVIKLLKKIITEENLAVKQCTIEAMTFAAINGHVEVVQWLHENQSEGCSDDTFSLAAGNGHLEMIQWLNAHGYKRKFRYAFKLATENGHIPIIKWLLTLTDSQQYESFTRWAMKIAIKKNQQGVIQWLESQVEPVTSHENA